ncbi:sodium:proton antiporter, partial [Flavobacterium sp. IR1]
MKAYRFPLFLTAAIIIGSSLGILLGERAEVLKPLGDIFLKLMFTIVVPLVFFSISAVIANMSNLKRLGTIMTWMMIVFIVTGIISSIVMIAAVTLSPPAAGVSIQFETPEEIDESLSLGAQIVQAVTVPDFVDI